MEDSFVVLKIITFVGNEKQTLHPLLIHILNLLTPLSTLSSSTSLLLTKLDTNLSSLSTDCESRDIFKESLDRSLRAFSGNLLRRDESLGKLVKEEKGEVIERIERVLKMLEGMGKKVEEGKEKSLIGLRYLEDGLMMVQHNPEGIAVVLNGDGVEEPTAEGIVTDNQGVDNVISHDTSLRDLQSSNQIVNIKSTEQTATLSIDSPLNNIKHLSTILTDTIDEAIPDYRSLPTHQSSQNPVANVVRRSRSTPSAGEKATLIPSKDPICEKEVVEVDEVSNRLSGQTRKRKELDEAVSGTGKNPYPTVPESKSDMHPKTISATTTTSYQP